jgi:hypothetical protein
MSGVSVAYPCPPVPEGMVALITIGERQIRLIELTVFFKKCLLFIIKKGVPEL